MNQQSSDQDSKFRCIAHPQYVYCALYLEEKSKMTSRLLCTKCQTIAFNNNNILKRVVPLQDFITNSAISIKEICSISGQELPNFEILQQIEEQLSKLEQKFNEQIIELRKNIKAIKDLTEALNQKICQKLELDIVIQQIDIVRNLDTHQGTIQFKDLEDKLEALSQNLTKLYIESNQEIKGRKQQHQIFHFSDVLDKFFENFKIISDEVNKSAKDQLFQLQSQNVPSIPQNIYDDLREFPLIHKQISERRKIEYQLIYQYSTDGLNYWSKCNNQSNLLTIMNSKNGQKFGGYSPCQIVQNKNNFVSDQTIKSFIFQYKIFYQFYTTKEKYII